MKKKLHNETISLNHKGEEKPVPIVSDAAIASKGIADNRIIPLLILDTSLRPDIEDMIKTHKLIGKSGDVVSMWSPSSKFRINKITLILSFTKPSLCNIFIPFDIINQGGILDQIIQVQGLYIQAGIKGDRLSTTFNKERILVEVPSKHFREEWNKIYYKVLVKDMKKKGISKKRAKRAASSFLKEWREISSKSFWHK